MPMDWLFEDWATLLRTLVVGVLAYAALIAILRVSGKRTLSQMNAFDFVVTVALGSTLATILLSRDVSLAEGVVAFLVLVTLQFAISWTSLRSDRIAHIAKSEPTALLYRGRLLPDAMRRERVLETEVRAAIREQGLAAPKHVDLVVLETDGTFSVVPELPAADDMDLWVDGLPDRVADDEDAR
jgi:uncharacterized membrane protein YcaP (DUF421 family)